MDESYKRVFLDEALGELNRIEDAVLTLERTPKSTEAIDSLMRAAHTMKGSSRAMGYESIADVSNAIEDVIERVRRDEEPFAGRVAEGLLRAVDRLRDACGLLRDDGPATDLTDVRVMLNHIVLGENDAAPTQQVSENKEEHTARISVSVGSLDKLVGITEELTIGRMRIEALMHAVMNISGGVSVAIKQSPAFREWQGALRVFQRNTRELQYAVIAARMTSLETAFARIPRMVRDITRQTGKHVNLRIDGADIEADRSIVERLAAPLGHLVRNALDHGIIQSGDLRIYAERDRDNIKIVVEDSGEGIQYGEIARIAKERGFLPQYEEPTRDQLEELLFHPHLSTSKEVSDISGRGVGLSAVREFVRSVGGQIVVETGFQDGKGTRFSLYLPVTLALTKVLLVRSAHSTFALPLGMVKESFRFDGTQEFSVADERRVRIGNEEVPLLALSPLLGLEWGGKNKVNAPMLVVVQTEKGESALLVDQVVREEEVLVKSLPPLLTSLKGFSGATVVGDGRTVLLLDPNGLADLAKHTQIAPQSSLALTQNEHDALAELMNIAGSHAATALAHILKIRVALSVPEVLVGDLQIAEDEWGTTAVGVRLPIERPFAGTLLFEVPESLASTISTHALGSAHPLHELDERERGFYRNAATIAADSLRGAVAKISGIVISPQVAELRVDARGALHQHYASPVQDGTTPMVRMRIWWSVGDAISISRNPNVGALTFTVPMSAAKALSSAVYETARRAV